MRKTNSKYTYHRGRKCEHCEEPIADHLHDSRKHCLPEILSDGSIKNCKTKRNNEKAGIKSKEVRAILEEGKLLLERVKNLVALKGNTVTTEDLDFHVISLLKALRNEHKGDIVISYFREFEITTYIYESKHVINLKQ